MIAPHSSKECHFCNWSIHSDLMLSLHPGDETKGLEEVCVITAVHTCIGVAAGEVAVDVEGCAKADDAGEFSEVGRDWILGG